MANVPAPGEGGSSPWFVVYYTKPQNTVSGRLTGPSGGFGTQASVIIQAATAADAQAAEQARLGVNATVTSVDGPYATAAQARQSASANQSTINKISQAGSIPDIFKGLNLSSWFVRIGEILAGLILVGIGLNAMLKGKPLQIVTSTAGLAARAVPA